MSARNGGGPRILVVEDDLELLGLLREQLTHAGYEVTAVATGGEGAFHAEEGVFDLIVLDLNLPDVDGLEVAEGLNGRIDTPIVMLTARGDVDSRVEGLYAGASDYVTKPFAVPELVARVHARLRERGRDDGCLRHGDLELLPDVSLLRCGDAERELPEREFTLLRTLVENPGRVFGRDELERRIYGEALPESNTVEVFVHNLRRKLTAMGHEGLIRTVRGKGYLVR